MFIVIKKLFFLFMIMLPSPFLCIELGESLRQMVEINKDYCTIEFNCKIPAVQIIKFLEM